MKVKMSEDLSKLSNLDPNICAKLLEMMGDIITQRLYESRLNLDSEVDIDLDFAHLLLTNIEGQLKIKLVPNKEVSQNIVNIEKGKKSNLKLKIEKSLGNKIAEIFKEIY